MDIYSRVWKCCVNTAIKGNLRQISRLFSTAFYLIERVFDETFQLECSPCTSTGNSKHTVCSFITLLFLMCLNEKKCSSIILADLNKNPIHCISCVLNAVRCLVTFLTPSCLTVFCSDDHAGHHFVSSSL